MKKAKHGNAAARAVGAALFCLLAASCGADHADEAALDVLIVNGEVYDGSGAKARELTVGVKGGEIAYLEPQDAEHPEAKRIIDAGGLIVAPGFIDPHTHVLGDLMSADEKRRLNARYLTQGVTTVFAGNDGGGSPDIVAAREKLAAGGIGTNAALFVGHGTVRERVMGNKNRAPSPEEMDAMKALIASAMEEGALGLSTGLYYVPGNYATTEEVIELARVAAGHGGVYESHIRDESSYADGLIAAVEETIEIGEKAEIPVHIAHIKALGADVWGKSADVVALVEAARGRGVNVTADQYPWLASSTSLRAALVPQNFRDGAEEEIKARFADQELAADLRAAVTENMRRRGGPDRIFLTGYDGVTKEDVWPQWKSRSLSDIAGELDLTPLDAALRIMREGDPRIVSFNMEESDLETFMAQPWVMTGSDGVDGHPRVAASYPKKYADYVKAKPVLSTAEFVRKSAGLVAETFHLEKRGYIKEGYAADIIAFDPAAYAPRATYDEPDLLSEGVIHVLVNGKIVIDGGEVKPAFAGEALQRGGASD